MQASNQIDPSSPENPLTAPATSDYPEGMHFFQVPDPRGKRVSDFRRELSDPSVGMAVVVEMKVSRLTNPYGVRWEFRYLWASWSLVVKFGNEESWELKVEKAGPRTEMQVRTLYELARDLYFRECIGFLSHSWKDVKAMVLPKNQKGAGVGPGAANIKATEEQAVVKLKLAAAKASSIWHKRNDPETIVLQAFLQGRTGAETVCELFDLDWNTCVPFLRGLLSPILQLHYPLLKKIMCYCAANYLRGERQPGVSFITVCTTTTLKYIS